MGEKQYIVFDKYDLDKALLDKALPKNTIDNLKMIEQVCKDGRIYRGEMTADYLVVPQTHPGYVELCKYEKELREGVAGDIGQAIVAGNILSSMTELPIDDIVGRTIDDLVSHILNKYRDEAVKPVESKTVEETDNIVGRYKLVVGDRIERITGYPAQRLAFMTEAALIKVIRESEPPRMQAKSVIPDPSNAEDNTERMMSLRSKELNFQEKELQKAIRKHNSEVAMFNREVSSIMDGIRAPVGYESLASILCEVMHQAAIGKGAQRHADSNPFERQPTLGYARKYNSPVGLLCQIMKKLDEYDRLDGVARRRELIGVMVYVAMLIIFDQEMHGYDVKAPDGIKGILYPVQEKAE